MTKGVHIPLNERPRGERASEALGGAGRSGSCPPSRTAQGKAPIPIGAEEVLGGADWPRAGARQGGAGVSRPA